MTGEAKRTIGVAMLGHGFMGSVHSRALRAIGAVTAPVPLVPRLVSISGRDKTALEKARRRYGWEEAHADWTRQIDDERVDLFDNVGPNHLHVEPTLAAIEAGKHVLCEKPLAASSNDAYRLWRAADRAGVVHACAFNYRFFPAIHMARDLIHAGELGELMHFRSRFFTPRQADHARDWRRSEADAAGGVVNDMAAHHIDLARFLVGEIEAVSAVVSSGPSDVDVGPSAGSDGLEDALHAVVSFRGGAHGTLEASRVTTCPTVESLVEVDGEKASIRFSVARLNELQISSLAGRRTVYVSEPEHPFMRFWYPRGHPIGWGDSFVHEIDQILRVIAGDGETEASFATFLDGYRCATVCDALRRSARERERVIVGYRELDQDRLPGLP
jgi:predicted dehydrogenase